MSCGLDADSTVAPRQWLSAQSHKRWRSSRKNCPKASA